MENVALEQDLRASVGKEATAGRFDLGDRQDRVRIDAEKARRVVDCLFGERPTRADEVDCQGIFSVAQSSGTRQAQRGRE